LRGSPTTGLWPQMGGKSPVQGRPAAPRRPGRGAARSGDAPAWETGAVVLGRLGSREGLLGGTGPWPKALEEGWCSGTAVRRRAEAWHGWSVRGLYRRARQLEHTTSEALRCGPATSECVRRPWHARLAGGADDGPPGNAQLVVRRSKDGSRSKDGRREGDHGPDLEAVENEPHACRGGCDCRSTARGADLAGRVPRAPAAL
jgi:hypothetical protein